MTAGTSSRQLLSHFGPRETVYYRFQHWRREGLWEQIRAILLSRLLSVAVVLVNGLRSHPF
jgi:transposase